MPVTNQIDAIIQKSERNDFKEFITFLVAEKEGFLLGNDISIFFMKFCDNNRKNKKFREGSSIVKFLKKIQELFISDDFIVIMHRFSIARYKYYILRKDGELMDQISVTEYLDRKDAFVSDHKNEGKKLRVDFMPFYDFSPSLKDTKSIGNGIGYLNRYLCSNIFSKPDKWNSKIFEFLKLHSYKGKQLFINGSVISDFDSFYEELQKLLGWLRDKKAEQPFSAIESKMRKMGFEAGWGNTAGRIAETVQILIDLLNEPTDALFEQFLSRVPLPMISNIAIISPHGWFGQENVLGRPDTGGQVIYILDQVRALERHLYQQFQLAGIDAEPKIIVVTRLIPDADNTTCNQRKEKIFQTNNGWILRVPFVSDDFNIVQQWISRFKVWPYLERFADDAISELNSEFQGRPDLIIGNYSDGNLVASLMSDKLDVIQCTIAHALEKTKYLFSDLYWDQNDHEYNFSIQFTADIIAMNKSDFIITSTKQEIYGTEESMGQYESYQSFSLPGLYQVVNGINLFAPKFNVIPPGVEEDLYFPFYDKEKRTDTKTEIWTRRLFHDLSDDIYGELKDVDKFPIFTMARFDKIKNITGLIEGFGMSNKLRGHCNLIFAAGTINVEDSSDMEEQEEIRKAYDLIERYDLHGSVRWLPSINKLDTGEVYRIIADKKGIFVQPALFEAFGLTILEAMVSGLPTFATKFGGPEEIIEYGVSGYLINPSKPDLIAGSLESYIDSYMKDKKIWNNLSENGIKRVREYFTWNLYSERLLKLAKLYGFWRYSVSGQGKIEMDRYSDVLYHFLIKERARHVS